MTIVAHPQRIVRRYGSVEVENCCNGDRSSQRWARETNLVSISRWRPKRTQAEKLWSTVLGIKLDPGPSNSSERIQTGLTKMGNAVTCSLVDVVGTVTVTQSDGQILEFVQPIFAAQVKKLHPGSWLVHYTFVQDRASGKHHGKMSMLQGNEELQPGQIYFLLPIPSHFRKEVFGTNFPKQHSGLSTKSAFPAAEGPPPPPPPAPAPTAKSQHQAALADASTVFRPLRPSPVFALPSSSSSSVPPQQQHQVVQPQPARPHKRCSKRHKIQVFDWQPTLMTIEEAY